MQVDPPQPPPPGARRLPEPGGLVVSDRLKLFKWPEENLMAPTEEGGGFYPVRLGETFQEARLVVTKKLGWGRYSTTWLVRDRRESRFVALKVLTAHATQANEGGRLEELDVLQRIAQTAPDHRGYARVLHLYEDFTFESFLGRHQCLLVDALSISAADLVRAMPNPRLTIFFNAQITRDVLQGLEYLHEKCDIVHCDLKPSNILVKPRNLDNIVMHELSLNPTRMYFFPKTLSPNELPFHPLTSDPLLPTWFSGKAGLPQELNWVITDFSHSFCENNPNRNGQPRNGQPLVIVQPLALRPPEILVGLPLSTGIDMWSLGCMMFEFNAAYPLFDLKDVKDEELTAVHIAQMMIRTGEKHSMAVIEKLSERPMLDMLNRALVDNAQLGSMAKRFLEVTYGTNPVEVAAFLKLMQSFLRLDPYARPQPSEALQDPFFEMQGNKTKP